MSDPIVVTTSYASYLLRLRWQLQEGEWVCQSMLTSVTNEERHYFANLESLVVYLRAQPESEKGVRHQPSSAS